MDEHSDDTYIEPRITDSFDETEILGDAAAVKTEVPQGSLIIVNQA